MWGCSCCASCALSLQDDKVAMDFVAASANLRAFVFGIPLKSRFDIKCQSLYAIE